MEDDVKEVYGIAAAISEALEAAVFADSSAAYRAYDLIEKYAYDYDESDSDDGNPPMNPGKDDGNKENVKRELAMAKFSMKDSNGQFREISIPLITMMPLPLLHITEAKFDISMNVSVEDTSGTNVKTETVRMNPRIPDKFRLIKKDQSIVPLSQILTGKQMVVQSEEKNSTNKTSTTVEFHVEVQMEQAELPAGIKLMLQAAANCIQSAAVKVNSL